MSEIKIASEVAGRICALACHRRSVNAGDEIAFVDAMKMEIPVASPSAGQIKMTVVAIDDVVAERHFLGTIEIRGRTR